MIWLLACTTLPDPSAPAAARLSLSASAKLSPASPQEYAQAGAWVTALGDVDGDGFGEVALGAPGSGSTGAVFVYSGTSTGLDPTGEDTLTPSTGASFGRSLAGLGDVDGDGLADLLVGDLGAETASLWLGSAAGLAHAQDLYASDADTGQFFGFPVASAGDVDGDGHPDALVGALGHAGGALSGGAVYLYLGSASGLGSEQRLEPRDPSDFKGFGYALGHGDFDGDGFGDVAVGAQGDSGYTGTTYVYFGTATGLEPASEVTLSASDAEPADYFGHAVAGLGDVDGDGFDELAVGAHLADHAAQNDGVVYVYSGSVSGLTAASERTLVAADGDKWDNFGVALAGGQDLNGDGWLDLVVGAWNDDGAATNAGAAYVFLGSLTGLQAATQTKWTAADADDTDYLGHSVALVSDLNGDGAAELLLGAEGDDDLATDGGSAHLVYGTCLRAWFPDDDGDGFGEDRDPVTACAAPSGYAGSLGDCAPEDPSIHPGALELPDDGVDQDCDGRELCWIDADGDGVRASDPVTSSALDCSEAWAVDGSLEGGDCDDADSTVSPLQTEALDDGVDQDCDGRELCYLDADQDHFHAGETALGDLDCAEEGVLGADGEPGDCHDGDPEVNPAASEEIDDALDSDCDGQELCFQDADGDGYRSEQTVLSADLLCDGDGEAQWGTPSGDCEDGDASVYPGALDHPQDGVDQDCDGLDAAREDTGLPADSGQVSAPEGCGCGGGGGGGLWAVLGVVLVLWRRGRVGRREGGVPRSAGTTASTLESCHRRSPVAGSPSPVPRYSTATLRSPTSGLPAGPMKPSLSWSRSTSWKSTANKWSSECCAMPLTLPRSRAVKSWPPIALEGAALLGAGIEYGVASSSGSGELR